MAAQIDKILDVVSRRKAIVQIIPFSVGAYAAADGYFVLLEFNDEPVLRPVVFIEGLTGNQYLKREADIARYHETIEYLGDRALSVSKSVELMIAVKESYASDNPIARSFVRE